MDALAGGLLVNGNVAHGTGRSDRPQEQALDGPTPIDRRIGLARQLHRHRAVIAAAAFFIEGFHVIKAASLQIDRCASLPTHSQNAAATGDSPLSLVAP